MLPIAAAPPPATAEVVGHSVQGRALRLVRIGRADAPVAVLVVGCIHGTERAGLAVTRALRAVVPPAGVRLLVLDALNPDGCARGTRGNARGVDLNRNFPWGWRRQGGVFASGPRPASEPETRAAMALVLRERPRVTIWFHQHMDLVDDTRGSDPAVIAAYARTARMRATRLAPLPGTASRWQNHRLTATSAFVVELPAGRLGAAAVRRHVRAVAAVARLVAPDHPSSALTKRLRLVSGPA
jgi:protein MpaA